MAMYDTDSYNPQGSTSYSSAYGAPAEPLQFYSSQAAHDPSSGYYATRPSLDGRVGAGVVEGSMGGPNFGGQIQGGWLSAFGTGGFEGEPPLLEELGINFEHIKAKSMAALNPFRTPDQHIMDDADLAGPLIFCFCFAMFLLFAGKPQFGYIYGVALLGDLAIYFLLNLMSQSGIDAYRVASVLGYCLLPLVLMSMGSVAVSMDGLAGYVLSALSIIWCTYSASGIFVSVLRMSEQRLLVAYPVGLFYASFALLSVFDALR